MKNNIIIRVSNVSKKFTVDCKESKSILHNIIYFLKKKSNKEIIALSDINFKVFNGDTLAILGDNGSGKSTLLKIISKIYYPDSGYVKLSGDCIYLNGFGHGMNPRLTMKENIFLMGSLMGIDSRNVRLLIGDIVKFSGLQEFMDVKVYQFSSGMIIRLLFSSTITFVEFKKPKIIILDEVFNAGGDLDFQKKAIEKMNQLIKNNICVIIASHDLSLIRNYANKVIWLKGGKIFKIGDPDKITKEYENSNHFIYR